MMSPRFGEWRKHGRARADDNRHLAPADAVPLVVPLAVGQAAVLHRHLIAERFAKRRRHGGRERNLRHEHQDRSAAARARGRPGEDKPPSCRSPVTPCSSDTEKSRLRGRAQRDASARVCSSVRTRSCRSGDTGPDDAGSKRITLDALAVESRPGL